MIDPATFNKLKAISDKEWGDLYKELVIYAAQKLTNFGFEIRSEKDNVTGEDFATQAIEKLFEGIRKWDFERFPDLLIHLKGIVKSLISSHLKSSERAKVKKVVIQDPADDFEDLDSAFDLPDNEDPAEILITDQLWQMLEAGFEDDFDGFIIFCDWLDNLPPREIAVKYEKETVDIYNALKRGRRIIKNVFR